jgi:hypothetical protein
MGFDAGGPRSGETARFSTAMSAGSSGRKGWKTVTSTGWSGGSRWSKSNFSKKTVVDILHRINKVVLSNHGKRLKRVLFFGTKKFGLQVGIVGRNQFWINKLIQNNDRKRLRYFGTKKFL